MPRRQAQTGEAAPENVGDPGVKRKLYSSFVLPSRSNYLSSSIDLSLPSTPDLPKCMSELNLQRVQRVLNLRGEGEEINGHRIN